MKPELKRIEELSEEEENDYPTIITLDASKKILLIDYGYFLTYRKNATKAYLEFADKTHEDFESYFSLHVSQNIEKITKKLKIPQTQMVLCVDAPTNETWRKQLYPLYKSNRTKVNVCSNSDEENINLKEIFLDIFEKKKIQIMKVPTLEADDIIALSIKRLNKIDKNLKFVIMTSDHDFLQLKDDYDVEIINAQLKPVNDPKFNLTKKILSGDKSDNIPPIYKRCGLKTAVNLTEMTKQDFEAHLKNKQCEDNFHMNKMLIDMNQIPKKIIMLFENYYKFKLNHIR